MCIPHVRYELQTTGWLRHSNDDISTLHVLDKESCSNRGMIMTMVAMVMAAVKESDLKSSLLTIPFPLFASFLLIH